MRNALVLWFLCSLARTAEAQCVDDPGSALAEVGGCAAFGCDADFNGSLVSTLCPRSCDPACVECIAISGERTGYRIANPAAASIAGLGQVRCDRGYVKLDEAGFCDARHWGISEFVCEERGWWCTKASCNCCEW